jgi:hypothetical protein
VSEIALELQWGLTEDDDDRTRWVLELHAIVAKPGLDHSRYTSIPLERFPAEELDERRQAMRAATVIAEQRGLPLHAPPIADRGGHGGSRWIRAQEPGPSVLYDVTWRASWWTDAGQHVERDGVERFGAITGEAARSAIEAQLEERFRDRPLEIATTVCDATRRWSPMRTVSAETASVDELRRIALDQPPSRVARALVEREPAASARTLMIAFEDAFHIQLAGLTTLARWLARELDDDALDDALTDSIARTRPDWDRPRRLREAYAAGGSVAAFVRNERLDGANAIRLIIGLRDVFGTELRDAKELVECCSDPRDDVRLDQLIASRVH